MSYALVRDVPPSITRCEVTHLAREPIDVDRARRQHAAYRERLAELGCGVRELPPAPGLPDSVFVEDTAVVLDELAVITRPGAPSRRPEVEPVAEALARYRDLARIEAPATLDGGDVLCLGERILIGETPRSNAEGIRQFREAVAPFGYTVSAAPVDDCLHLKSAVTRVAAEALLLNPGWVDPALFPGFRCLEVDPHEPFAANALAIGDQVLLPAAWTGTRGRLEEAGLRVVTVAADELAKAEGGLTCCSLVFD